MLISCNILLVCVDSDSDYSVDRCFGSNAVMRTECFDRLPGSWAMLFVDQPVWLGSVRLPDPLILNGVSRQVSMNWMNHNTMSVGLGDNNNVSGKM